MTREEFRNEIESTLQKASPRIVEFFAREGHVPSELETMEMLLRAKVAVCIGFMRGALSSGKFDEAIMAIEEIRSMHGQHPAIVDDALDASCPDLENDLELVSLEFVDDRQDG